MEWPGPSRSPAVKHSLRPQTILLAGGPVPPLVPRIRPAANAFAVSRDTDVSAANGVAGPSARPKARSRFLTILSPHGPVPPLVPRIRPAANVPTTARTC